MCRITDLQKKNNNFDLNKKMVSFLRSTDLGTFWPNWPKSGGGGMRDLQLPESCLEICQICQKPFIEFKEETSNSINYMFVKSKVA